MTDTTRPLLVFDLDETLLHCQKQDFRDAEHSTEFGFVAVRPGVDDMLDQLADHYDFMIWSNNGRPYIDKMLSLAWPAQHTLVDVFTSSESSILGQNGMGVPYFKETRKVAKKHPAYVLDRILGIDNDPGVYRRNYGNLVTVKSFTGDYDEELSRLADYLERISRIQDLRKVEKRYWRSGSPHAPQASTIEP